MSLFGRTTDDYSPLRGPITNPHTGKDIRPRWERQKYEEAVNARREMMGVFDSMPQQKLSKKERERLGRIKTPANPDPDLTHEIRVKMSTNAHGRNSRVLKDTMHPAPVEV